MTPLQTGDMLQWFRIESVLGRGGFGITYLATDTNLDHFVAIKEYAPDLQVDRQADQSIQPVSSEVDESYQTGLSRFISEARTLVKFNHPNIVRILTVFSANNTAYLVMDFEEGEVFNVFAKANHPVSEKRLKEIFVKIIDGLTQVHTKGFLHRDIKPGNIIIRPDGNPVLLDFGCARPSLLPDTNTQTAFVSPGYSPLEQFHSIAGLEEGPWTDIYALSATLHFAITKQTPTNSASRLTAISSNLPDPLARAEVAGAENYSAGFLQAIDWGLQPTIIDRPKSLTEWRDALSGSATQTTPIAQSAQSDGETVLYQRTPTVPLNPEPDTGTVMLPKSARTSWTAPPAPTPTHEDHNRSTGIETDQPAQPWDESVPTSYAEPERPTKSSAGAMAVAAVLICVAGGGYLWHVTQKTPDNPDPKVSQQTSGSTNTTLTNNTALNLLVVEANQKLKETELPAARKLIAKAAETAPESSEVEALHARLVEAEGDKLKLSSAQQLLQESNFSKALEILAEIQPDAVFKNSASALEREIREAQATKAQNIASTETQLKTNTEITTLLSEASYAAERGQWKGAIERFREVAAIDAGNTDAQAGTDRASVAWLQSIEQDIVNGRLESANEEITLFEELMGKEDRLVQLESMLDSARQQEQDAQATEQQDRKSVV